MVDVLRFAAALALLSSVAVPLARSGLLRSRGAWAAALLALVIGLAVASQIPERETMALATSAILNADIDRVIATVTDYGQGNYRTAVHPLQCMLYQPPTRVLRAVMGLSAFRVSQVLCVLCLSASAGLLWFLLRRSGVGRSAACVAVGAYVVSFGFIFHAAIPESAGMAAPTVLLPYVVLARYSGRPFTRREGLEHLAAGVLCLSVSTTNVAHAFACVAVRSLAGLSPRRRSLATAVALCGAIMALGAGLAMLQTKLYPGCNLWFDLRHVRGETRWCRQEPLSAGAAGQTALQLFGLGLVGPQFAVDDFLYRSEGFKLPYLTVTGSPLRDLSGLRVGLLIVPLIWLVASGYAVRREPLGIALILGLAANLALHLAYGYEYLLYVGDWLPAQCALLGVGQYRLSHRRAAVVLLAAWLCLVIVVNVQTLAEFSEHIRILGADPRGAWRTLVH